MSVVVPDHIKKSLSAAVKAAAQYQDADKRELASQSVLLSHYLGVVQSAGDGHEALLKRSRTLIESMVEQHGIPSKNALIRKLAKKHPKLSLLWGAVKENGAIADIYQEGRQEWAGFIVKDERDALLDAYYRRLGGVTLDQIWERFGAKNQPASKAILFDALMQDENTFYTKGLFYPASQFCQGRNGFQLIDALEEEAAELNEKGAEQAALFAKMQAQIVLIKTLMRFRPIERIPITLNNFGPNGYLRLDILNSCPRIAEMGRLYLKPNRQIDLEPTVEYAFSSEAESLVNRLNGNKLSYQDDDELQGSLGVNSAKRKEFISLLTEDVRDWIVCSEHRFEVELEFNRRFNGYINKTYSDAPFSIAKLTPPGGFSPHPYQFQDVRQLADQGKGILGWAVGLGKTVGALMLILHLQERGLCRTAMIVTPKSLVGNWLAEIQFWTTGVDYILIGLTQLFWADGIPAKEVPGYEVLRDQETGLPIKSEAGNYLLHPEKSKARKVESAIEMTVEEFERRSELQFSEDSPEEKLAKLQSAAANTYDIVLMWRDTFKSIPLSPAIELKFLENQVRRHLPQDDDANYFGDTKDKETIADRRKQLLDAVEKERREAEAEKKRNYREQEVEQRKKAVLNERRGDKMSSALITLDQIIGRGDILVRDESHDVRNLWSCQKDHAETKGAQINPSQRSYDFYLKCRYLLEENDGRGVYLLTATPLANNPIDLYAALQYYADEEFLDRGIYIVDDFVSTFGKVAEVTAPTMSGNIRTDETLIGFQLLSELRSLFNKYAILRDGSQVNFKQPKGENVVHIVPLTPEQSYLYVQLIHRMEEGLALLSSGPDGWAEFKESPWLFPFSVLSDMDKLALCPLNYLKNTKYGTKLDKLTKIARTAGMSAYALTAPINSYLIQADETILRLTEKRTEAEGFPVYHATRKLTIGQTTSEDPDYSDHFYEVKKIVASERAYESVLGTLGDFSEKRYGDRLEDGAIRTVMDVDYKLTWDAEAQSYNWAWVDGYPWHSKTMYHLIKAVIESEEAVQAKKADIGMTLMAIKRALTAESKASYQTTLAREEAELKVLEAKAVEERQKCEAQPGDRQTHRDLVHILNERYRWEREDGQPMPNEASPKFQRLVEEGLLYYHAGYVEVEDIETGDQFSTTPHGLFLKEGSEESDVEATLANWRSLHAGQEFTIFVHGLQKHVRITRISGGNQVIFADQVGASDGGDKDDMLVFKEIKNAFVAAGIPAKEIELIYGAVSASKRQAISQRYRKGDVRITVGHTATLSEGLNFQGGIYPTTAIMHMTLPWHGAAINQREGRGIRQGNPADRVDTHYFNSPGTIDFFRHFTVLKKRNFERSILTSDVDEMTNETGIPQIDELCAALALDPLEAKRRLEEARAKEANRVRQQKRDRALARLAQLVNQLSYFYRKHSTGPKVDSSIKDGWYLSQPGLSTLRAIKELITSLQRAEEFPHVDLIAELAQAADEGDAALIRLIEKGSLHFFVSKSKVIFQVGDVAEDRWKRLWKIHKISLWGLEITLQGVYGRATPCDINGIPAKEEGNVLEIVGLYTKDKDLTVKQFGLLEKDRQRLSTTRPYKTVGRGRGKKEVWNWRAVAFTHTPKTAEEILTTRLAVAKDYLSIKRVLTPEEIERHRAHCLKQIFVNEKCVFYRKADGSLGSSQPEKLDKIDSIVLPHDPLLNKDNICRLYCLHKGDTDYFTTSRCTLLGSIGATMIGMSNEAMQKYGYPLVQDFLPSMEEIKQEIIAYFNIRKDSNVLGLQTLVTRLGSGRGLDKYELKIELGLAGLPAGSIPPNQLPPEELSYDYFIKRTDAAKLWEQETDETPSTVEAPPTTST